MEIQLWLYKLRRGSSFASVQTSYLFTRCNIRRYHFPSTSLTYDNFQFYYFWHISRNLLVKTRVFGLSISVVALASTTLLSLRWFPASKHFSRAFAKDNIVPSMATLTLLSSFAYCSRSPHCNTAFLESDISRSFDILPKTTDGSSGVVLLLVFWCHWQRLPSSLLALPCKAERRCCL